MTEFKGFTRIAAGYDALDVRLAIAALEGAGYTVITPGLRLNEVVPQHALAFGPIPIHVPDADADTARALLAAIDAGTVEVLDPVAMEHVPDAPARPLEPRLGWLGRLGQLLGFAVAGVARPARGVFIDRPRRRTDDGANRGG